MLSIKAKDNAIILLELVLIQSLYAGKEPLAHVMAKITVIACVEGNCQFMQPRSRLGFYENTFRSSKIKGGRISKIHVVACGYLGCTKKMINNVKIF